MPESDVTAEIIALDRAWEDAIVRVDPGELDRLSSEDLVYTHAGGWIEGKASFIDHIVNGPLLFPVIKYEDISVLVHGTTAVLTCALHLETTDREGARGELHFRVTHVWTHEDGRWLLLANQSTHIPAKGA